MPADAAEESLHLAYRPIQPWGSVGMRMVKQFDLNAFSIVRDNASVTRFARPLTIVLRYADDEVRGMDLASLRLFYLDEEGQQWVPLETIHDWQARTLTAQLDHFSIFGAQANPAYSLPGSVMDFQTDLHSGAAISSYPIDLPPGPGGFQPTLALRYNSGSIDEMKNKRDVASWVGVGWSFHLGRISYNEEKDKYYLDWDGASGELVYDSTDGRWHTKPEAHLKITKETLNGHEVWEVWDRDGTYYRFGGSNESIQYREKAISPPANYQRVNYRFDLSLMRDTHGNEMTVTNNQYVWRGPLPSSNWSRGPDSVRSAYPQSLSYDGGQVTVDLTFFRDLGYSGSCSTADGCLRGDNPRGTSNNPAPPVVENGMLWQITVKVGGTETRRYEFDYGINAAVESTDYGGIWYTGEFWLSQISQKDASNQTLVTTTFLYDSKEVYFYAPEADHRLVVADTGPQRLYQFDGLGRVIPFYVQYPDGYGGYYFEYQAYVDLPYIPRGVEFDAAKRVFVANQSGGAVHIYNTSPWWADWPPISDPLEPRDVAPGTYAGVHHHTYVADIVDGNGKAVRRYVDFNQIPDNTYPIPVTATGIATDNMSAIQRFYVTRQSDNLVSQYNQDGTLEGNWSGVWQPTGIAIENTGSDWYAYVVSASGNRIHKCRITNFNQFNCILQFGHNGSADQVLSQPQHVAVADGFVYVTDQTGYVYVYKSDGQFVRRMRTFTYNHSDSTLVAPSGIGLVKEPAAAGPNPGSPAILTHRYLTTANNGFGATVSYTYQEMPASRPSSIWTRQVVTAKTVNPGVGQSMQTTYTYTGDPSTNYPEYFVENFNYFDAEYRGFGRVRETATDGTYRERSFYTTGSILVTDPETQVASWEDADMQKGREYQTTWHSAGGQQLQLDFYDYSWEYSGGGLDLYTLRLDRRATKIGTRTVADYFFYDSNGNIIREEHRGDTAASGDESTVYRSYVGRMADGAWLISKPKSERTYTGIVATDDRTNVNLVSETLFYYDGETPVDCLAPAQDFTSTSKGDLTRIHSFMSFVATSVSCDDGTTHTTTRHRYDTYGNRDQTIDPKGNTTTLTYDSLHPAYVIQVAFPTVPGGSFTETYAWDFVKGVATGYTDINGQTTSWEYDSFGRLTTTIRPGDDSANPTERYGYLDWGTLTGSTGHQRVKIETKVGAIDYLWREEYFDGLGRVIQVRQHEDGTDHLIAKTSTYNGRGLSDKEYAPWRIANTTNPIYVPPTTQAFTSFTYDAMGRILTTTGPDGAVTGNTWEAASQPQMSWRQTVTDPLGHQKRYTTDTRGNLAKVEELDGSLAPYQTTTYTYDTLNNLTDVVVDPMDDTLPNPITTMTYDWLGRKTAMSDPDMGTWSYTYDGNGNLLTQTDARGVKLQFVYDALGRMTERRECTGADCSSVLAAFGYDSVAGGNVGKGRRTSMSVPNGPAASFVYDSRGRLTQETATIQGTPYTTSYSYDAGDRLSTVTLPNSEVVTQTYTSGRGLPATLSSSVNGTLVSSSLYNQLGLPTQLDLGNGVRTSWEYWGIEHQGTPTDEQYGRLYRINTFRTSDDLQHQDLRHRWDAGGNLSLREDGIASEAEAFAYDSLDRLTAASYGPSGLMSYWSLDAASLDGATVRDVVRANDGTNNGAATAAGRYGQALAFDGADDYVRVAHDASLVFPSGSSITLSVWVKPDAVSGDNTVLIKGHDTNGVTNYGLAVLGGQLRFIFWSGDGTNWHDWRSTSAVVPVDVWSHLTVTFTFGTGSSIAAYVNGVPVSGSWVTGDGNSAPYQTTEDLLVGLITPGAPVQQFDGLIDEARVYGRALSAMEVADLSSAVPLAYRYDPLGNIAEKADRGGYAYHDARPHAVLRTDGGAPREDLLSLWAMDAGTVAGASLADLAGGNDGTVTGATVVTGTHGDALSFDGVDDYVRVAHAPACCSRRTPASPWPRG